MNANTASNVNQKGTTKTATMTNHIDLSNTAAQDGHAAASEDEAQCLVGGTSEKFVSEPMGEDVTTDLINGLRRVKDAARWKVHFKVLQEEKDKETQRNGNTANNTQEEEQEQQPHNPGLKPISNLPRLTFQPPEQMTKLKDSSHNSKRNFSNKHFTKLTPKDETTNPTKSRACNKN